jgi:hypothetical protein
VEIRTRVVLYLVSPSFHKEKKYGVKNIRSWSPPRDSDLPASSALFILRDQRMCVCGLRRPAGLPKRQDVPCQIDGSLGDAD